MTGENQGTGQQNKDEASGSAQARRKDAQKHSTLGEEVSGSSQAVTLLLEVCSAASAAIASCLPLRPVFLRHLIICFRSFPVPLCPMGGGRKRELVFPRWRPKGDADGGAGMKQWRVADAASSTGRLRGGWEGD